MFKPMLKLQIIKPLLVSTLILTSILTQVCNVSAQSIIIIGSNPSSQSSSQTSSQSQQNNSSNVIVINGSSNNQIIQNINNQPSLNKSINNWIDGNGFNAGNVISDSDIYSLPTKFDSISKIQAYLESQGSFLANYQVEIGFENDDDLWASQTVKQNIGEFNGKKIPFSEFVWRMARTNLGNSCSLRTKDICIDQTKNPINPAVILALIQRESGLIKGKNAKLDPNSDIAKFLTDRAVGYMCLEDDNKTNSCWDQNPDWKYFKGLFRQVYYGIRLMLINAKKCDVGNYGSAFRTGNVINIDGSDIKLENGFSCSIYIYTPHILAQKSIHRVYKEIVS
jgi:hypothetical protein